MSERLTRKEIKHDIREDRFRYYVARSVTWIAENSRTLVVAAVAVIVLIAAAVGYGKYRDHRAEMASQRLAEAIEVFEGEAATANQDPAAAATAEPAAMTDLDARRRAAELFAEIRDMAGDEGPGAVASAYLGRIALADGDTEEARRIFSDFVDQHSDHMLAAAAEVALVELDRQSGDAEAAAERLRAALEDGSESALPADVALYQLARTLETLGRDGEARSTYRRLSDEYPGSPYVGEASSKVESLAG